jgi:Domain of unknown function (DUF3391)
MLKKIPVGQLRVGMHLHALEGPWMSHPFWRTRFVVSNPADLRKLLDSAVTEVWIDPALGLDVAAPEPEAPAAPAARLPAAPNRRFRSPGASRLRRRRCGPCALR